MTRLALWAASVIVAWWLGREYELRLASAMDARADEMDAVQPADPWPPIAGMTSDNLDLTYTDAITRAAIRRTAQRDDVSTGGM